MKDGGIEPLAAEHAPPTAERPPTFAPHVATAWNGRLLSASSPHGWLQDLKNNEAARKAFKQKEWNKFRVECVGDSIKTWLNGVPAADLKDSLTKSGFIGLQVHGVGKKEEALHVRFRNLRLKDLSQPQP